MVATLAPLLASCGGGAQRGAPLADPSELASVARTESTLDSTLLVQFEWDYADERGPLRGEGAARVNPPDHLRIDLFTTAEGSLAAVLVDAMLDHNGDLEGVELPPASFSYAMAGLFRPGPGAPTAGFESDGLHVLEYESGPGATRSFYLSNGRLTRVEERRNGRVERRIVLTWGESSHWPREASYRDDVEPRTRVRWELLRVRPQSEPWPEPTYELPKNRQNP
ncbi:MAG: hypothetical protein MJB57_18175 [Gemmatimonadetes bacterium]|nr:hypothetical protein [Gemmatimonadota bacterium]